MCRTIDDWKELKSQFSTTSRRQAEKALALQLEAIAPEAIHRLEAIQLKKEREEARRERARQLEALPRKRSRRLEAKVNDILCQCPSIHSYDHQRKMSSTRGERFNKWRNNSLQCKYLNSSRPCITNQRMNNS